MLPYDLDHIRLRYDQYQEWARATERVAAWSDPGAEPPARRRRHPLARLGRQLAAWSD